jgi:hypothetical protein
VDAGFHDPGCRCYDGGEFEWTGAIRKAASYANSGFAERILTVRYEDLVSNPEKLVREICAFLGEAFEHQMLDWQEQTKGVPARERHIHSKLSQPISDNNIETWRRRLSGPQCFVMESCLGNELRSLGYPMLFNRRLLRPVMAATATGFTLLAPLLVRISMHLRRRGLVPKNAVIF